MARAKKPVQSRNQANKALVRPRRVPKRATIPAASSPPGGSNSFSAGNCIRFALEFAKRRELLKLVMAYYLFFAIAAGVLLGGFFMREASNLLAGKLSLSSLPSQMAGLALSGVMLLVFFAIVGLWVNGFMTSAAGQFLRYRAHSTGQAKAVAFARFPTLLGVVLLSWVASFASSAVVEAVGSFGGKAIASVIDFVASLALTLAFLYAPFDAVLRPAGAFGATKASFGRFARMPFETALLLIAELAVFVASAIAALLVGLFAVVIAAVAFGAWGISLPFALVTIGAGTAAGVFLLACLAFASQFSIGLLACAVEKSG